MFQSNVVPPGGDPGTWLSTARAYVGQSYPSQTVPLAYPPVLFPLLGLALLGTGSPITAAQVFAPTLYFALGLSIFYLATRMLRSRVVALVVLSFVMIDPQLIEMVFWGAYPNLLGFIFLYLAMAGLVLIGSGSLSRGAALFWTCGALTVLTHSLTGLVLAGTTAVALFLSWPLRTATTQSAPASPTSPDSEDSATRLVDGLFRSRGGRVGLIGFSLAVGAYYVVTALAHVPHPNYFVSSSLAFTVIGLGGVFRALFPGLTLLSLAAVYLLAVLVILLLIVYSVLLEFRPAVLSTSFLVLLSTGVTILVTPVFGWVLRIVTDYTRFGFFLLIPTALSLGYLIDRGWVSNRRRAPPAEPKASPLPSEPLHRRWLRTSRRPRRVVAFAIVSFLVGLLVATAITAPALGRLESTFTRVGHDQNFIDALHAIQGTGLAGNILTVPGADKWARAITNRDAYAPYSQSAFLFFQSQVLDSDLSYYALTSHFAITNGLVSAQVRGTAPSVAAGIPAYGVYVVGSFRPVLEIAPSLVTVELVGVTNHTAYQENLTGSPSIVLPPSTGGGSMKITYNESNFIFTVNAAVVAGSAEMELTFDVTATGGNDAIRALNLTLVPSSYTSANVWPGASHGLFDWDPIAQYVGPITTGNVTPASALEGMTPYDPASNSPAVVLSYGSPGPVPVDSISGEVSLSTPGASSLFNDLPSVIITPDIWSQLGIRFVLMRNSSYAPSPNVAYAGEVAYLEAEYGATYGLSEIYQNPEWTVLEISSE